MNINIDKMTKAFYRMFPECIRSGEWITEAEMWRALGCPSNRDLDDMVNQVEKVDESRILAIF